MKDTNNDHSGSFATFVYVSYQIITEMALPDSPTICNQFSYLADYNLFACNKEQFGKLINYPSLKSNSITKIPETKKTVAYSILDSAASEMRLDDENLASTMADFIEAADFYRNNNLKRMVAFSDTKKNESCMQIAEYIMGNHTQPKDKKLAGLCEKIYNADRDLPLISPSYLILLLLGLIDTSTDISHRIDSDFEQMASFAESFFVSHTKHGDCPMLNIGRKNFHKYHNRFFMMSLFDAILWSVNGMVNDQYDSYKTTYKDSRFFDIEESIWTDRVNSKLFYSFELAIGTSGYSMTVFEIEPGNKVISYTEYYVNFSYDDDNRLVLFVLHPMGSYYYVTGQQKISMKEKAWLYCDVDDRVRPNNIRLTTKEKIHNFEFSADTLSRMSEDDCWRIIKIINNKRNTLVNKYEKYEARYFDGSMIYALTHDNIFLKDVVSGEGYYCVPIELDERLESIQLNDPVGICNVGGELYIGFEPIDLYYRIATEEDMTKCGIKKVDKIF